MVNPGPDQPSHGHEYPSLENTPQPSDAYAPVDYPTNAGQPPPAYPGPFDTPPGMPYPGYPQPGYPQGGYPPPAMPGAPYQPYPGGYYDPYRPAAPTGTNGKAIAALVTSLLGLSCCLVPGVVGIILGVIAMRETKQTGQDGHGMALAGVIIGALALAFGLFGLVLIFFFDGLESSSSYSSY